MTDTSITLPTIKDIKVKIADTGIESLVLINDELLPCSSIQIIEQAGDLGKLLLEIPLPFVEVIGKNSTI